LEGPKEERNTWDYKYCVCYNKYIKTLKHSDYLCLWLKKKKFCSKSFVYPSPMKKLKDYIL